MEYLLARPVIQGKIPLVANYSETGALALEASASASAWSK
jgi:hypothetical protein